MAKYIRKYAVSNSGDILKSKDVRKSTEIIKNLANTDDQKGDKESKGIMT